MNITTEMQVIPIQGPWSLFKSGGPKIAQECIALTKEYSIRNRGCLHLYVIEQEAKALTTSNLLSDLIKSNWILYPFISLHVH